MNGHSDGLLDAMDNGNQSDLDREAYKIEQEALDRKIKLGKANEHVLSVINNCKRTGATDIDLSKRNISTIPEEVLSLTHVESLYLEGNNISMLPEDFFQKLPCLKWLDLRNNVLKSLPSAYIGSHQNLTHLLVQGNLLQALPLELSQVMTLKGLNIGDNPLKFPAKEIVNQGVAAILKYMRMMLFSKSNGNFKPDLICNQSLEEEDKLLNSDGDPIPGQLLKPRRLSMQSRERPQSAKSDSSELYGTTLSLHKQATYQELRRGKLDKIKKAGASGKLTRQSSTPSSMNKRLADPNLFPEPPSVDLIDQKVKEKQYQAIMREKNERTDAILQRRKDEDKLKKFREDAKTLQRQKDYEKYMNGGRLDYVEPGQLAPFDIANEDMKMMSNEERIKKGVKEQHERIRKVLSPQALKLMELEKQAKDRELQDKIKDHSESMKTRRKKPKGNPQEEMAAALKELEIAKMYSLQLENRYNGLKYIGKKTSTRIGSAAEKFRLQV